ncbi:MAG: DUF1631 family protein [Proteobacteria bacterium]|nr:DUF1631 family protein [Pseudomonadota bacterium]
MSDESARPLPTATVARILGELGDGLRARLREPLVAVFDALDDALFDLGERTQSGQTQQILFDALRECRRQRSVVIDRFVSLIGDAQTARAKPAEGDATLALVDPDELELQLAIDAMAARAGQRLSHLLHAFDQRVAWLQGVGTADSALNPFGPYALCNAIRAAAAGLAVDLQTLLILFKIFERQVLGALEPIYAEVNVRLAAAGVLPLLGQGRARAAHAPHPEVHAAPVEALATHAVARHSGSIAPLQADERELLTTLRNLLLQHGAAVMTQPIPGPVAEQATAALDHALARAGERPLGGQPLPPPRLLASQVLDEVRQATAGQAPSPQQSATVDILGRVFDAMASDQCIPSPMQPVMQTLMLPVMRASLRHPGLIAEDDHPLRQLIDLVAENAIGWCPSADPGAQALNDLQYSLQKIAGSASPHDADTTVAQLRAKLEQQRRRSDLAEQRAVEAHAGRERLWQARRQVNQALLQTIGSANIPSWVRYLVTRPWMNCLVLLWLRQGPDSPVYREALGFAESMVWCATAGSGRIEHLRMRALLPIMENQLRQGLAMVAYQDHEIRQLVGELQEYVRYRVGDLPAPAFIEAAPPAGIAPGALAADPGSVEEQPLPHNVNPDVLARVRGLRPGTWFTFADRDKDGERVKLSWVSPYSGRCLFVNRNGLKIREQRPEDLAWALEQGLVSIVEGEGPLLQRALSNALHQARDDDAKSA